MTEEDNKMSTLTTKDNELKQVRQLAKQPGWSGTAETVGFQRMVYSQICALKVKGGAQG